MRRALSVVHTWGEMIRFSHSLFALPFAVLATFLAARPQLPQLTQFGLILLAMVGARSAAMTFNRLADARLDAMNPRAAARALPRGRISPRAAWLFFAAACAAFVLACVGSAGDGNPWPILCIPVLLLLCLYSYTKRITRWSHLALGAAIGFSPVAAWIAISPQTLGAPAWLLMVAALFWIGGFDVIYACQDVEFYRRHGVHSLPAKIGIGPAVLTRAFSCGNIAAWRCRVTAAGWLY